MKFRSIKAMFLMGIVVSAVACKRGPATLKPASLASPAGPASTKALARGNDSTMMAVNFLEERVKSDPDDIVALNKLSGYYLQLHRETDDVRYLEHSLRAAQTSLRVLPADQNLGGLRSLAQAEYETHNFVAARDHAQELIAYEPNRSFGFQLLGDAELELGSYEKAAAAYQQMESLDRGSVAAEARLAHLAMLRGDSATARKRYLNALAQAKSALSPSAETIAWTNWQLGELAKAAGQYDQSLRFYHDALAAFPGYSHAVSSLAQLHASQGELEKAIEMLEALLQKHSDPMDAAMLGDLYKLSGRERDAEVQYLSVEHLCQKDQLYSVLYNRHLVLFWTDHDIKTDEAYVRAQKEYQTRRDIYAADAFAWASLKAGKLDEAQTAINDALRLGTKDARLFYHAGMIAKARGDRSAAEQFLKRALEINQYFDPMQSRIAAAALKDQASAD